MLVAVLCICSALLLYTIAIWSERRRRKLIMWMIVVFCSGLLCDITGTTLMSLQPKTTGSLLHTYCGFTALGIMAVHLLWALAAYWRHSARAQWWFTRCSIYAWYIWLAAFMTGLPWHKLSP